MYVPSADNGDWLDGITVTVMSFNEIPPLISRVTGIIPDLSELV